MALQNGVLVHGPRAWAAAIRLPDGRVEVAAAPKRLRAADVEQPFLRGPARLFEALAILPELRRRLPAAKLPFERPGVLAAMLGSAVVVRAVRGSERIGPAAQELVGGLLSLAPGAPARARPRAVGPRAPAPPRDRRADAGAARSRRGGPARVPRPRTWRSPNGLSGSTPRSSTSPSRRCGRATTQTRT